MSTNVNNPVFWDEIYRNEKINWDLKGPNRVFVELLKDEKFMRPGKILISGSGKGYDAISAYQEGYEVAGVDFSSIANEFAENLAEKENANVKFIQSDIFKLDGYYNAAFDYVYDYTTYCAFNPSRREEYAKKIAELLKPNGKLIALWFPVEKREGGPPFGINLIDTYRIFSKYLSLELSSTKINSIKPRKGREVLQVYVNNFEKLKD